MILSTLLAAITVQAGPPATIEGRWINPSRDVIIVIAPCAEKLCGKVQWATAQAKADARKGVSDLIGADLLTDLSPNGDNRWKGKLFIPDRNMRVTAKLSATGADQLKVSGCTLGGMLCDSQTWSRSQGPPPGP